MLLPQSPFGGLGPWHQGGDRQSVLKSGAFIERLLTSKERAQLFDLREDWGETILDLTWTWDQG